MVQAIERGCHEVGRPFHRRWQFPQNRRFKSCHRTQAPVPGRTRMKVNSAAPGLAQGAGHRVNHPGQFLDAVQFSQSRFRQHRPDGFQEGVFLNGLRQAAGQPHRELFKGNDLAAVTTPARRFEPQFLHCHAAVSHYRMTLQMPGLRLITDSGDCPEFSHDLCPFL